MRRETFSEKMNNAKELVHNDTRAELNAEACVKS